MNNHEIADIVICRILQNLKGLSFGAVSVILTVHQGTVVSVSHEIKEITRERTVIK
jgi:hypothetical protein